MHVVLRAAGMRRASQKGRVRLYGGNAPTPFECGSDLQMLRFHADCIEEFEGRRSHSSVSQETPTQIEQLRCECTQGHYAVGDTVFAPIPNPSSLYILEAGLVRIYRLSEKGLETSLGYVKPGEVFGELTIFGDYPRESFAQAVDPSVVWRVPRQVFQPYVESTPSLAFEISKQIGERLKRIESRVENLVFRDVHTRVMLILAELESNFGIERDGGSVEIDVQITQSELATLVGSSRQSVNASLSELTKQGLLGRAGPNLVLLKPDELRKICRVAGTD
jgi:CRP-like cAMP-binding protein